MGTPSRRDRNAAERRINGVGDGQRKWFLLLWHKMIRKEFQMKKEPSVMSPQGSGDSQNGSIDQRGK